MADKDFKVKTGLDLGTPLPLTEGGTGQTSANNALNALLPVQTDNSGKFLQTDGTYASWSDTYYSQVAADGVVISSRKTLNLIGATISDDSPNNRTNVTIGGSQYSQVLLAQDITGMTIL